MTSRKLTVVLVALMVSTFVTSCTSSVISPAKDGGIASAVAGGPDDVPADHTDYSVDAGNETPEYEYVEEPSPPPSVVGILCNFNREYFEGLRSMAGAAPVADDVLRTNLVALSDLLGESESLRRHFPEAAIDIDIAQSIYDEWDAAILSADNGDAEAATKHMGGAEELIDQLPGVSEVDCSP